MSGRYDKIFSQKVFEEKKNTIKQKENKGDKKIWSWKQKRMWQKNNIKENSKMLEK